MDVGIDDPVEIEDINCDPSITGVCIDKCMLFASCNTLGFIHNHEQSW